MVFHYKGKPQRKPTGTVNFFREIGLKRALFITFIIYFARIDVRLGCLSPCFSSMHGSCRDGGHSLSLRGKKIKEKKFYIDSRPALP